jgi:NAD(P)H dehydrogenase (quinone)
MATAPGWKENAERMNKLYEAPTPDDAAWADAIIFGSPTRFGAVTSELKAYIDSLGGLWFQGKLVGKAGSAFTSTGTRHGGNESTILSMYNFMAHLGLIIVPLGYGDPAMFAAGTPYGASSVSGQNSAPPTAEDLAVAQYQGRRVAQVAKALKS